MSRELPRRPPDELKESFAWREYFRKIDTTAELAAPIASPVFTGTVRLPSYTVAGLPAGTVGEVAYVTDATAPTYLGALTGGGAVHCLVLRNATGWVAA